MNRKIFCLVFVLTLWTMRAASLWGQTSQMIPFSGTAPGQPDGSPAVTFKLYNAAIGGSYLNYSDAQPAGVVTISGEWYDAVLGAGNGGPVPADRFVTNPSVYVAIELTGIPGEIGPRVPLYASGYAQSAASAATALSAQTAATFNEGAVVLGSHPIPILSLTKTASGPGLQVAHNGTSGSAVAIQSTHPNNADTALSVTTNGKGNAGAIIQNNPNSPSAALYVEGNGDGPGTLTVVSKGKAPAGTFQINAANNPQPVLAAFTSGKGMAGQFAISNPNNNETALSASTNGSGGAGFFKIQNIANGNPALYVSSNGPGGAGRFESNSTNMGSVALNAYALWQGRAGVFAIINPNNDSPAVDASTNGASSSATAVSGSGFTGVQGKSPALNGNGVIGTANSGSSAYGVWGQSTSGYAGYFSGNVQVSGDFTVQGRKAFLIDHPVDPANKYLYHSAVESADMKNLYDGVAVLDAHGEAVITLPEWFEALNRNFRYQLTCLGGFAPVYIAEEISGNRFKIAGGAPRGKVSWQVTGIRQDAWAQAHPMAVEVAKPAAERGYYLAPAVFGASAEKSIEWAHKPALMQRMKAAAAKPAVDPPR